MKKIMNICVIAVILTASFFVTSFANQQLTALTVPFKIYVNDIQKEFDNPIVAINDRTYLPLRETAEILDMNVEWDEESQAIFINAKQEKEEDDTEMLFGDDGKIYNVNLNITKETALKIGDAILHQVYSQEFIDKTILGIRDLKDGTYAVYRYEKDMDGGSDSYIIDKKDGRVVFIEHGE